MNKRKVEGKVEFSENAQIEYLFDLYDQCTELLLNEKKTVKKGIHNCVQQPV